METVARVGFRVLLFVDFREKEVHLKTKHIKSKKSLLPMTSVTCRSKPQETRS